MPARRHAAPAASVRSPARPRGHRRTRPARPRARLCRSCAHRRVPPCRRGDGRHPGGWAARSRATAGPRPLSGHSCGSRCAECRRAAGSRPAQHLARCREACRRSPARQAMRRLPAVWAHRRAADTGGFVNRPFGDGHHIGRGGGSACSPDDAGKSPRPNQGDWSCKPFSCRCGGNRRRHRRALSAAPPLP